MKADDKLFPRLFSLLIPALCVFLGIAIQIQASFGMTSGYSGLRINLADILLPLTGLIVLGSILLKKSSWPRWAISGGIIWPILLTAIMAFALINGYLATGEVSNWALVNKFAGWLVLVCYFGLGAWLATNYESPVIRLFLQSFVTAFLVISLACFIHLVLKDIFDTHIATTEERQLKGLMGNRNAFAFLVLMTISLMAVYAASGKSFLPRWSNTLFWISLPVLLVYDGSRAGWVAASIIIIVIACYFKGRTIKSIFLPLIIGLSIVTALYTVNTSLVLRERQGQSMKQFVGVVTHDTHDDKNPKTIRQELTNRGDFIRLRVLDDALAFWKESPVIGIGLGSFLKFQLKKYGIENRGLDIIDTTPLWLLTETGIVGVSAFLLFCLFALNALWRGSRIIETDSDILRLALIFTFIGFAIMSLFHELLYSRHLWLMLGMALAVPRQAKTAS